MVIRSAIPARISTIGATIEWACRPAKCCRLASNLCHVVALPPDHADVKTLVRKEVRNEARRSADFLWALARPGELLETTEVEGRAHLHEPSTAGAGHCSCRHTSAAGRSRCRSCRTSSPCRPPRSSPTTGSPAQSKDCGYAQASGSCTTSSRRERRDTASARRGAPRARGLREGGERTYAVRFLDSVAELPAGPAVLARVCGAPVVPFSVLPLARRRWRIEVEPPLYAPDRNGGVEVEKVLLQKLADRWTVTGASGALGRRLSDDVGRPVSAVACGSRSRPTKVGR